MLCTISDTLFRSDGSALASTLVNLEPATKTMADAFGVPVAAFGASFTTSAGGAFTVSLHPGLYVGRYSADIGEVRFSWLVPNQATATATDCLTTVTEKVYSALEVAILVASGIPTYTTTSEGIAATIDGQFFMVPLVPVGLGIFENVAGVATGRGGLLTQNLLANGSAAAPSLAASADTDTGIFFPAANQVGFSAGGVLRALLTAAGLQVTGLLTGTAVTQTQTDTTPGRLLKVGDFGLGGPGPLFTGNVDTITANGAYTLGTGANSVASPVPALALGWQLVHWQWDANTAQQIVMQNGATRMWLRRRQGGAWQAWEAVSPQEFGLGSHTGDLDANAAALVTRFFRATINSPFSPTNAHVLHISRALDAQGAQIAVADSSAGSAPVAAVRQRGAGSPGPWSSWNVLFGRLNLLGAVSQSGGVPTGAVIERGSNANGEFVRFADGTQICTRTNLSAANANTALGSLFRSADVPWTFPAAFAAAPVVTGCTDDADTTMSVSGAPTTTAANVRALAAVTKGAAITIRAQAIGRWF